jgi:hypothetical protein
MSFMAKYPGRCDDCREAINVGEEIQYKGGPLEAERRLVHVVCDGAFSDLDRDAERPVCPKHWLIQPCGECEVE